MIKPESGKYRGALLSFLLVLLAFLVLVTTLLVTRQRQHLFSDASAKLDYDINQIGVFIREPMLRHDYDEVEQFIMQWGEENKEVLYIKAVMPNKFILVEYSSPLESAYTFELKKKIQYLNKDLIEIKVVKDFESLNKILTLLQWQLIGGSFVLTMLLGVTLWFTMNKFSIKPLRSEIEIRRKTEAELYEAKANLESIVQERTKDLKEKNKELEQIVYVTSHDLRSPLVNIDGYNKMIRKALEKVISNLESGGEQADIRAKVASIVKNDISLAEHYISASVEKINNLLLGLLQLSRWGRLDIKREILDMNEMLTSIGNSVAYQLKEAGVKFEISELPSCNGDRVQINQVFSNLIDNAIKYCDPKRQGELKVSGNTEENQAVYCIEDNGIGISSEYQKKIFELFHQLNPAREGEGVGLTIVQRIINRHNGKIWLESEKDGGSKFFISLPNA